MPFDFAAVTAPFRMQPGLRRIAPGTPQLTPTRPGSRALGEKLAVLQRHAGQALLCEPGFDATPALQALAEHAAREHPSAFALDADGRWHARVLGWSVGGSFDGGSSGSGSSESSSYDTETPEGDGPAPIGDCLRALPAHWRGPALLALAFEQDFAVLDATTAHIAWTAVCLPSRWAPEEKVGRAFAQVHAPVADNTTLLAASDALVRLVTGAERWERFVWTVTADASLDEHPRRVARTPWPSGADPAAFARHAFWRTEHQTFIPLPERRQAVFTIHVENRPLVDAIDSPARAEALHAALSTMSPAVLAYRGLVDAREPLLAWLAMRTSDGAAP
jgi:hypothetical protein